MTVNRLTGVVQKTGNRRASALVVEGEGVVKDSSARSARFERLWASYPKKVGRKAALKAFTRLDPGDAVLDVLIAAVERQKASVAWQKDGGRFVPFLATWLNGERWRDELELQASEPRLAI
jgi:hypothetical protein